MRKKTKTALVSGITGQDGSYLAKYLIDKGYKVYGLVRRTSLDPMIRLDFLKVKNKINFLYCDLSETSRISDFIKKIKPNLLFNLGAQSFVTYSYENPVYTDQVNNLAVINFLENIRIHSRNTRFYQASSSEMYGSNIKNEKKLSEKSYFNPISPYSIAKLSAYHYVRLYRNSYNIFASNGILFNHESPLRGDHFVTKKIIKGLVEIKLGIKKDSLKLGNIYSKRDWGHAKDYVKMMYKILKQKRSDDFVISSEKQYSIKQFADLVCKKLNIKIFWSGKGINEKAIDVSGKIIIEISKRLFRPQDVTYLLGDASKAKKVLNWKPKKNIDYLIDDMIKFEFMENNGNYKML